MKLKLRKKLIAKTGKVKSIDFHPNFSWILLGLYNGSISIYDFESQSSVQYLEVNSTPIRAVKFMPEKNYIISGSDDRMIRVFNYNTMEKIKEFEAHQDFIRAIGVHQKDPLFITCSDDGTINLYNVEKNFALVRTYSEHRDFVMKVVVNPKEYDMFASCSMDKTIKIWSFSSKNSHLTLEGHKKGIGAICFCPLNDKPYLASGGDDSIIKIWDYTNKNCIFTLRSHEGNISALSFHPELPVLVSGAEDCLLKFWNINNGKLEESRELGYDIPWDIGYQGDTNVIGVGYDEATVVFQMGNEQPLATFSHAQSKIIYSLQNAVYSLNLKQIQKNDIKDGEIITSIQPKQLGNPEIYPNGISYSKNGRYFFLTSSTGEFIISTSGVYRNTCVGSCNDISWCTNDSFVTKEGSYVIVYKELKVHKKFRPEGGIKFEKVFGGPLFGLKTADAIYFYDIENCIFIRKIDVFPKKVIWDEGNKYVALVCDDVTFVLKVDFQAIEEYVESVVEDESKKVDDGCEKSFEMWYDISEVVQNGVFVDEVFIYQNNKSKIGYIIDGKPFPVTILSARYYLLGYLESTDHLYLIDKKFNLISYNFPISFIKYQVSIINKNYAEAEKIYKDIPDEFKERVMNFLEKFGEYELTFNLTSNLNQKFSLALKLKKLEEAKSIAEKDETDSKMKMVADLAIELGEFSYAEEAMKKANDYNGLLLYYSSIQDKGKIKELAELTKEKKIFNVSFACYFQLNCLEECIDLLIESGKVAEASLFARTYCPSKLAYAIEKWNETISNDDSRVILKMVNPVNEENEKSILGFEKQVFDFYEKVKESTLEDRKELEEIYETNFDSLNLNHNE